MLIQIKLFAVAKERAGQETITVDLPANATIANMRDAIQTQHPSLAQILPHALWAVDTAYANDQTPITEQSEIALIPPVSGG
jgi:molybdopterin converting factor subunit 1